MNLPNSQAPVSPSATVTSDMDPGFSRTLTAPSDNPLRNNSNNLTQNSNAADLVLKRIFRKLENLMAKEIRAFWDVNTLTEYIQLEQIPRGLRIKKFPTFEFPDEDPKLEWTNTLSACSFKLMKIIIDSKQKELDRVQMEITEIQKELATSQSTPGFLELDNQLNKKLDKLEKEVISTKSEKHIRDQLDYDTNNV